MNVVVRCSLVQQQPILKFLHFGRGLKTQELYLCFDQRKQEILYNSSSFSLWSVKLLFQLSLTALMNPVFRYSYFSLKSCDRAIVGCPAPSGKHS